MPKFVMILLKVLVPVILFVALFRIHPVLGTGAAILAAGYLFIRSKTWRYSYVGRVKLAQGKQEEALRWLSKAAARKDCKPFTLIGLSYALLKRGDADKAEELLNRVRSMDLSREDRMNADSNAALLLWKRGRLEEAVKLFESLNAEYTNTNLYGSLGYFYILQGDLDRALAFNREAYAYNGSSPVIIDNLGQTLLLRGELDEALELYEKLAGLNPGFPEAYYNHGLVLEALGRTGEALERVRKALEYPVSWLSTVTKEEMEERAAYLEQQTKAG